MFSSALVVNEIHYIPSNGQIPISFYKFDIDLATTAQLNGLNPYLPNPACDPSTPNSVGCQTQQALNPDCATKVSDPIDVATGSFIYRKTLLELPNVIPLDFEVAYSSLLPADTGLGFGLSHRFGMTLAVQGDLSVTITWPSGRITRYLPVGNGYTVANGDPQDVLVKNGDGSFTLTDLLNRVYQFASNGLLQSETQLVQGVPISLDYTWSAGRLQSVADPVSGKRTNLAYGGDGRVASVSAVEGGLTTASANFTYDFSGNLITISDALGKNTQFAYDANHRLLTGVNELGQVMFANAYDAYGRVVAHNDGIPANPSASLIYTKGADGNSSTIFGNRKGASQSYTYDNNARLIRYRDELGNATAYTYDAAGNRTSETDALNRMTSFAWDARANLTSVIDANGKVTSMTYNGLDKLLSLTNPLGQATTFQYSGSGALQSILDPLGNPTQFAFPSTYQSGTPLTTTVTLPRGGTMQVTRNAQNTSGSVADSTGVTLNWQYDPVQRKRTEAYAVAPADASITTYDPYGRILMRTDPLGHVTSYAYDSRGRFLSVTNPLGSVTSYAYDANDRLVTMTNALSQVTQYTYDPEDRVTKIADPSGQVTLLVYDARGHLTQTSVLDNGIALPLSGATYGARDVPDTRSAGSATLTYTYDGLDRPTSVTDSLGQTTSFTYDDAGRRTQITDALGRKTVFAYDPVGRLTGVTDALNNVAAQAFDADGDRVALADTKGQTTTFAYDATGRLSGITTPDGSTVTIAYNGKGQAGSSTNGRGQTTTYSYDAAGRLAQLADPSGAISYTYDANGNRLSVSDSVGTITRQYDALNRITRQTDVYGNAIQYAYDAAGNLVQLTYPGGKQVTYTYDNANRLTLVTDWANRQTLYQYDYDGRVTLSNPGGWFDQWSYDAVGQITNSSIGSSPGNSQYRTYRYDAVGSVVSEVDPSLARPATPGPALTYDNANRLIAVNGQAVSYDVDGNMLNVWNGSAFDTAGYDSRNRLVSLGNTTFTYDADNNRVGQTSGGTTTRYVVDSNARLPRVLMETDGSGTPTAFYVYGLGLIGRQDAADNYLTYHYDRRGSTVALVDTAGIAQDTYQYGPYGELVSHLGATSQPFLYDGRDGVMTDSDGLYYMRARYYGPQVKRFLQRDIIAGTPAQTPSLNRYAYALGNPARFIDPSGREISVGELIGSAITGALFGGFEAVVWGAVVGGIALEGIPVVAGIAIAASLGAIEGSSINALSQIVGEVFPGSRSNGSDFFLSLTLGALLHPTQPLETLARLAAEQAKTLFDTQNSARSITSPPKCNPLVASCPPAPCKQIPLTASMTQVSKPGTPSQCVIN